MGCTGHFELTPLGLNLRDAGDLQKLEPRKKKCSEGADSRVDERKAIERVTRDLSFFARPLP